MTRSMTSKKRLFRGATLVAVMLAGVVAPDFASAGDPPIGSTLVQITSREQPIGQFLQSFFGQLSIPVVVSANLRGTVNGSFNGPASTVYNQVTEAFDLISYYDGTAVYVYDSSELSSQSMPASPQTAIRVSNTAREMGLTDGQNTVQSAGQMLVVSGTRRFMQQIGEISRGSGGGTGGEAVAVEATYEYRVFTLRYAWAEDVTFTTGQSDVVIPGVASILRAMVSNDPGAGMPAARRIETRRPNVVPSVRGQGLAFDGLNSPQFGDQQGTLGAALADEQMSGGAPVQTARIQADSRLNAIIVRDTAERMGAYEALIEALDKEPQMLEIEATIIDIDTTRARNLGISWRFDDGRGGILFGDGSDRDLRLRRGADITPTNEGLAISTIIGNGDYFVSRITALEEEGVARVVSRPQIVTLSNVEALFENTQSFYVGLEGERDVDLFNVTSGTTLRVTPHVLRDQNQTRIRMQIQIEDGSVTDADVDDIPVVERSAINTQAMIVEGQSLLLGGMVVQQDINAVEKVPILGDIPGVGLLFRRSQRSTGRIERLFLITPRLASMGGTTMPRLDSPLGPMGQPLPPPPTLPEGGAYLGAGPSSANAPLPPPPALPDREPPVRREEPVTYTAPPPPPPPPPEASEGRPYLSEPRGAPR